MGATLHKLQQRSERVKTLARECGFEFCGISQAGFLEEEAPRLENWLRQNPDGQMGYMENHFDKRLDPTLWCPIAKSVVSLLLNYYAAPQQTDPEAPKISRYAYGTDYHTVIKQKLAVLLRADAQRVWRHRRAHFYRFGPRTGKSLGTEKRLGLGGQTQQPHQQKPRLVFLYRGNHQRFGTAARRSHQGLLRQLHRCIDACPTDAITEPYSVDGSKCIVLYDRTARRDSRKEFKGKLEN